MLPSGHVWSSFEHEWWLDAGEFKAGAWLFREGDPVQDVYTISQGLVRLVRAEPNGRTRTVGLRWPGSLIGGVSITLNEAHRCSASALLPTRVRRLPAPTFRARLSAKPEFLTQVIDAMLAEFRGMLDDSTRNFLKLPQQRLHKLLCAQFLGATGDGALPAEIRLPHTIVSSDLADLLHVSHIRLNHLLCLWQHAGLVRNDGDAIAFNLNALCADDPVAATPISVTPEPARLASPASPPLLHTVTDQRVHDAIELIQKRCANRSLNLRQVSRQVNLSLWHLSRLFRRTTGLGFREFVNAVRLEHARVALETTHLSVKEIAALVGYNHTSDLTRRFKAMHGMSPTAHRARLAQR